ncbi:MAG: hypothetical protein LC808_25975 [Actinobacteria bacterium]|nr:hypothetical protein [Actinomycetota bacterium]
MATLVALREADGDLKSAVDDMTGISWQALVMLIAGIVLITMLTQAFEFEAIRLLEGYWGTIVGPRHLSELGCRFHSWRNRQLRTTYKTLDKRAFADARNEMLTRNIDRKYVDILEGLRTGNPVAGATDADVTVAKQLDWVSFAHASDARRMERLEAVLDEYPTEEYRILPTRLGNTIRAYEDQVYDPREGRLEGSVLRIYHQLPLPLQSEHDQYRTRLDLYCSLSFVMALSAVAAVPLLAPVDWGLRAGASASLSILAVLSYRAAVASARGYGTALLTIKELQRSPL